MQWFRFPIISTNYNLPNFKWVILSFINNTLYSSNLRHNKLLLYSITCTISKDWIVFWCDSHLYGIFSNLLHDWYNFVFIFPSIAYILLIVKFWNSFHVFFFQVIPWFQKVLFEVFHSRVIVWKFIHVIFIRLRFFNGLDTENQLFRSFSSSRGRSSAGSSAQPTGNSGTLAGLARAFPAALCLISCVEKIVLPDWVDGITMLNKTRWHAFLNSARLFKGFIVSVVLQWRYFV